mmetsp:Transcript_32638/g.76196  ORF Transcript_32638/g.76196 Transcript_32638/m.76196 type:complete len:248 (+) Transcript_32638:500-1243(+)
MSHELLELSSWEEFVMPAVDVLFENLGHLFPWLACAVVHHNESPTGPQKARNLSQDHCFVLLVQVHQRLPQHGDIEGIGWISHFVFRHTGFGSQVEGDTLSHILRRLGQSSCVHTGQLTAPIHGMDIDARPLLCQEVGGTSCTSSDVQAASSWLKVASAKPHDPLRDAVITGVDIAPAVDLLVAKNLRGRVLSRLKRHQVTVRLHAHLLPSEPELVHVALELGIAFHKVGPTKLEAHAIDAGIAEKL